MRTNIEYRGCRTQEIGGESDDHYRQFAQCLPSCFLMGRCVLRLAYDGPFESAEQPTRDEHSQSDQERQRLRKCAASAVHIVYVFAKRFEASIDEAHHFE